MAYRSALGSNGFSFIAVLMCLFGSMQMVKPESVKLMDESQRFLRYVRVLTICIIATNIEAFSKS